MKLFNMTSPKVRRIKVANVYSVGSTKRRR
jgi:hypothetical protein